ncbi:hypothetical protein [Methylobacterium sp. CCH5-D2]|uniref:hypothetical protein n=1 Tax=Methylobacterium sp. CCH5-D2 TaxID=1768765 RepID=UPI00082A4146|nr:hypothetical protein [Methylobacterium sp. CCH5-D2]
MRVYSSALETARAGGANGAPGLNNGSAPSLINPESGVYGAGRIARILASGNWTVPPGVTRIRVRAWGSGASQDNGASSNSDGIDSKFGNYLTAGGGKKGTQGAGNTALPGAGGTATGGDINRNGGSGNGYAGGAAGNLFTPGDLGGVGFGANGYTGEGASLVGGSHGRLGRTDSLDFIGTGGGGNGPYGRGANGGGGGGATAGILGSAGDGGFPGGGTGGFVGGSTTVGGNGGGAFCLKEISGLTPGTQIACTVGQTGRGGAGLIVIEY